MSHNQNTASSNQDGRNRRLVIKGRTGGNASSRHPSSARTHSAHRPPPIAMYGAPPPQTHAPPMLPHPSTIVAPGYSGVPPHFIPQVSAPVAADQLRSHRVYVDAADVGFVIGGGGATIKRIKTQTGALVKYFPPDTEHQGDQPTTGYFNIRGTDRQIHTAKISIQELVIESKRRKIAELQNQLGSGGDNGVVIQPPANYTYPPQSPTYAPQSPKYAPKSPTYSPHTPTNGD